MDALLALDTSWLAALLGLLIGIVLGLAARLGRFCTLGAIEDALYGDSTLRLRMWGIAIGVAIIGSFALLHIGMLDPAQTLYLGQKWSPAASILGGLTFGYGMALAGNCGYGALSRLGGGDLRAMVIVLIMGIAAYATLSGPLAPIRVALFPVTAAPAPSGMAHDIAGWTGIGVTAIGVTIGAMFVLVALASRQIWRKPGAVIWGGTVGACIVAAWAGTAWLSHYSFGETATAAPTFAAPLGEAVLWIMTASGQQVSFALGTVVGVWVGAMFGAALRGLFRWEACDDPRELRRQIIGAGLMGVGGVVAAGCSIGQGLSGMSLLAWSAPVTLAAIVAGAAIGLRQLITGFSI